MINTSTISAVRFDHEWIKIEIGSFRLCSLDWGHTLSGDAQPGFIATLDNGQTITGHMSEVTGWRRVTDRSIELEERAAALLDGRYCSWCLDAPATAGNGSKWACDSHKGRL